MRSIRGLLLLVALSGLVACSGGYAPVSERSINSQPLPASGYYSVRSGDTLYSIAWRYNLDYRELARLNGIDSRYLIYPGQRLRLQSASAAVTKPSSTSATVAKKAPAAQPVKVTKPEPPRPRLADSAGTRGGDTSSKTVTKPVALEWRWPSSGTVLTRFSGKGIDIAGKAGDPVLAAGPGRVVYAGDGLRGYGNLVIINHNQEFLSAYAHNSRVFVKENDMVKSGEKIAEIGSSGAAREMLHFEIRRDGQPVDPLQYLPKR
ncbi:lipoprotein NlpD/LppB [Marinobacterium nitratireducens]|uniref:Lipoprotein NlpD/LppB n=1 Tax=Marinobacterium nitratireducens TaxID=518897 RepID=A0A917ZJE9_9GAMM|nr:peptidoglycan DD-metalloendopeptidase family protein [Marinobacterium nitratireducens]GGO84585.1 lipoprotein NlpD/LppB [Marinobacterium nitratireducens]